MSAYTFGSGCHIRVACAYPRCASTERARSSTISTASVSNITRRRDGKIACIVPPDLTLISGFLDEPTDVSHRSPKHCRDERHLKGLAPHDDRVKGIQVETGWNAERCHAAATSPPGKATEQRRLYLSCGMCLCTMRSKALVRFAIGGGYLSQKLFVRDVGGALFDFGRVHARTDGAC